MCLVFSITMHRTIPCMRHGVSTHLIALGGSPDAGTIGAKYSGFVDLAAADKAGGNEAGQNTGRRMA